MKLPQFSLRTLLLITAVVGASAGLVMLRIKNSVKHLPLIEAADTGDFDAVKWQLDHGADVNGTDLLEIDTALIHAAGRGHAEIAKYLVSRGADVNGGRERGRSALVLAICNHHPELAKWLIEQGADVNLLDERGNSVLHYAAHYGTAKTTELLLARGAAIDLQGVGGRTPLYNALCHRASTGKDVSVAQVLLEHGADPNIGVTTDRAMGDDVRTPLEAAAHLKFPELEELLRKHGAKPRE